MTIDAEEVVARTLDAVRRRAIAEVLDHIADMGWILASTTTEAILDPRVLARRVETGSSLVSTGDRGTVDLSPAPTPEGAPHVDDQSPDQTVS
jgi:hypothetical protein